MIGVGIPGIVLVCCAVPAWIVMVRVRGKAQSLTPPVLSICTCI